MIKQNVIEAIGNTPIVKLNNVTSQFGPNGPKFFAKLEFMNPGGSIKDRLGSWLVDDAEKRGNLKPGGTIVEGTSGNTGVGLAIAAAIKGYKCIFVLPDKMSFEKIRNLRAFGAKVVVTPTAVEPDDPRSYYQVSRRLARETPNAFYMNQYDNLANRECHYKSTGPEILKQMPNIDVFVAGIGTGGTICGVGQFLRENRPTAQIVAVDPVGSIVYEYFKTGVIKTAPKTYKIEGIGEDFIPKNYDLKVIDDMIQVEDKESFLMTRDLLTKEGLFCGISSGSAVVGAMKWAQSQGDKLNGKNILIVLPDSGNRYLSKVFDDDWMREMGFLGDSSLGTVQDLLNTFPEKHGKIKSMKPTEKVSAAIRIMSEEGISQIPVIDEKGWVKGVITEHGLMNALYNNKFNTNETVDTVMDPAIEFIHPSDSIERLSKVISSGKIPLISDPAKDNVFMAIVTKIDLLRYMEARNT